MPPLNLELLMAGDDAEWDRAYYELGLGPLALSVAEAFIRNVTPRRTQFAEDIASTALAKLWIAVQRGRIDNPRGLRGLLRKITRDEAIGWYRRHWFTDEIAVDFGEPDADDQGDVNAGFVRAALYEFAVQAGRPQEEIIEEWAEAAELDGLEKAMFREHIANRCTLEDFAETHQMHLSAVFRLKTEVLRKLQRLFRDER